jgi:hypothetical protein
MGTWRRGCCATAVPPLSDKAPARFHQRLQLARTPIVGRPRLDLVAMLRQDDVHGDLRVTGIVLRDTGPKRPLRCDRDTAMG